MYRPTVHPNMNLNYIKYQKGNENQLPYVNWTNDLNVIIETVVDPVFELDSLAPVHFLRGPYRRQQKLLI